MKQKLVIKQSIKLLKQVEKILGAKSSMTIDEYWRATQLRKDLESLLKHKRLNKK